MLSIQIDTKRSHSIHILSIQIDTKSFEVVIYHQFNNIKLSFFPMSNEIEFSIMYGY